MGRNNKNPNNSTLIQSLLEIMCHDDASDDIIKAAQDLYNLLKADDTLTKKIDTIVRLKDYADDKISFAKISQFNIAGRKYKLLTANELMVLDCMIACMSQHNKITLHINDFTDLLPLSRRKIIDCIKSLISKGFIVVLQPAINRKSIPAVYMVNPDIATCGKKNNYQLIDDFYRLSNVKRGDFTDLLKSDYIQQCIIKVDKEKYGTIKHINPDADNEKNDCATGK